MGNESAIRNSMSEKEGKRSRESEDEPDEKRDRRTWRAFRECFTITALCMQLPDLYSSRMQPSVSSVCCVRDENKRKRLVGGEPVRWG